MIELWKEVEEGIYVSNLGNFYTLEYKSKNNRSIKSISNLNVKKDKDGYFVFGYKGHIYKLHRLIYKAFGDNFNNELLVHHKDENKNNNCIINLSQDTFSKHSQEHHKGKINSMESNIKRQIASKGQNNKMYGKKGKHHPSSKAIVQLDLMGQFIKKFDSMLSASKESGVHIQSISNCCRKVCKKGGKYVWLYEYEYVK